MSEKRYVISVKEIGQELKVIERQWEQGAEPTDGNPNGWGYTPEIEATRSYAREVFQQTVDELDLAALVSVVNGIGKDK